MKASLFSEKKRLAAAVSAALIHTPLSLAEAPADATVLPEVVVNAQGEKPEGYNPPRTNLPKAPQPLVDTPQTITVVPQQLMEDQNSTTLRDALRNVTGLSLSAGEGGAQGDSLTLRGYPARSDLFLDGMRDFGNYNRDPFNIEQVEVLKGSGSLLFGRGSTGGVVNQSSKLPTLAPVAAGTLTFGTDRTRRATADINRPLSADSAFRLNLMGNQSDVAERRVTEVSRFGLAPSVSFKVGNSAQVTLSYFHQSENNVPDYGMPLLFDKPAPVVRDAYYGFADANFFRTHVDLLTARLERKFSDQWRLRNQFRAGSYERRMQITAPRLAASTTLATPLDSIQVNRSQVAIRSRETVLNNDLGVTGSFAIGESVRNTVIIGTEAVHEKSTPRRTTYTGVPTTSLTRPTADDPFTGTGALSSDVRASVSTVAAYLTDRLELGRYVEFNGGARWDHLVSHYDQSVGATSNFSRIDNLVSWRGGLVLKPLSEGSVYFSYGTSFNPSAEAISLSAANSSLDPEKNRSMEVGTKWDVADGALSLTAAAFRDDKLNARTPDPVDPTVNVLTGKSRSEGFEVGATGSLTPKWQIFTGYTFLRTEVLATNRAGELGARLANSPAHTVNVWTSYVFSDRVDAGVGVRGVTRRTTTTTRNATTGEFPVVPGYVTAEAMARYRVSPKVDVQANVYNILNTFYFDSVYSAHVVPGAGRTVLVTTSFQL